MKLLSVGEAAERLGVSKNAVYALCSRDHAAIRHLRLGTSGTTIRIPEEALGEYISGATVETSRPAVKEPPRRSAPLRFIRSRL